MFAKVDVHWIKEGMVEKAKAQITLNTAWAKKSGGVISRSSLWSHSDPLKCVTVTFWESKEALEKWRESVRAERAANPPSGDSPWAGESPWAKIEGDEYDATQLV